MYLELLGGYQLKKNTLYLGEMPLHTIQVLQSHVMTYQNRPEQSSTDQDHQEKFGLIGRNTMLLHCVSGLFYVDSQEDGFK